MSSLLWPPTVDEPRTTDLRVTASLARSERLAEMIRQAAHYLPAQGPITAFVHHNTLHAFEDLPFHEGVVAGGQMFTCHPYLLEEDYRERLAAGRITREDIEAVLMDDLGDRGDQLLGFLGTRFALRRNMLAHPLRTGPAAEVRWAMEESEALRRFRLETPPQHRDATIAATEAWVKRDLASSDGVARDERASAYLRHISRRLASPAPEAWDRATWETVTLQLLWLVCRRGVSDTEITTPEIHAPRVRHRDLLLAAAGQDCDQMVHALLIPFCAAYLDQGLATWSPLNGKGFFASFAELYSLPLGPPDPWRRPLAGELRRITREQLTPLEVIDESLHLLGVSEEELESYVQQSLLALRGFAGMIWQLETRGDRAAWPAPRGTLVEFLAVRLLLDRLAAQHVARHGLGYRGALAELAGWLRRETTPDDTSLERRAFLVFQLAQLQGWTPETMYRLSKREWQRVTSEIESFSRLERRRIYHLAFERRYYLRALDAIVAHQKNGHERPPSDIPAGLPEFQIVTCLDEREESFRRHLEEVNPRCETLGAAGFFSVAMYYRGAAEAHFTPLCPVIIKPQHFVTESVAQSHQKTHERRRRRRKTIATVTRRVHIGSRTFAGGWLAALFGSIATLPLVMRILFPRATAQLRRRVGHFFKTPALTDLQIERRSDGPGPKPPQVGYTVDEMATVVERLLRDIGLTSGLARLVVACGHGSSSLNNPHESAYDCGACGGSPGGPNARAFALMANNPRVRELVAERGIAIPRETHFLGAYHNTCDDSVAFYDLDELPASHRGDFDRACQTIDQARRRNAHERCRRFASADLSWSPDRALEHVEERSEDLSQARPELGHASNALCFVGRRSWSRGLYLDRRAYLQSYDPALDDERHSVLERVLQAVVPVCVGINLEYFFSYVDPSGYGSGTKLPHNITSLVGVMDGSASDLRTGLPWQMVEIHEPMRLLTVVEAPPAVLRKLLAANPSIDRLVRGEWMYLASYDPEANALQLFVDGDFRPYRPQSRSVPVVPSSVAWYRGERGHLGFASVCPPESRRDGR